jgi:hypothetical protein
MARVLSASFARFHPEIPFFTALADEVEGCFDPGGEPFGMIPLDGIVPDLNRMRFQYTAQEFTYALTPAVLLYLLDAGFTSAVFLKQESLVVGALDGAFDALVNSSVLLTPHLLRHLGDEVDRELNILQSGVYNCGFIGVTDGPDARKFLAWWRDRLSTHCVRDVAEGLHFEQRWLDLVPAMFDGVRVSQDPGLNVGHWNLPERSVVLSGGEVRADGVACSLFRFSGFDVERPDVPTRYSSRLSMQDAGEAASLFRLYRDSLIEAGYFIASGWPYSYGRFDNGAGIPDMARRLFRQMEGDRARFGDPFRTGAGSFHDWLTGPAGDPGDTAGGIPRLWREIYRERPDIRQAFPDPCGADAEDFLRWAREFGAAEYNIAPEFVPGAASSVRRNGAS